VHRGPPGAGGGAGPGLAVDGDGVIVERAPHGGGHVLAGRIEGGIPTIDEDLVPDLTVYRHAENAFLEGGDIGLGHGLDLDHGGRGVALRRQDHIVGVLVERFPGHAVHGQTVLAVDLDRSGDDVAGFGEHGGPDVAVLVFPGLAIHGHGPFPGRLDQGGQPTVRREAGIPDFVKGFFPDLAVYRQGKLGVRQGCDHGHFLAVGRDIRFFQPLVFTGTPAYIVHDDAGARREIPGLREGHTDLLGRVKDAQGSRPGLPRPGDASGQLLRPH